MHRLPRVGPSGQVRGVPVFGPTRPPSQRIACCRGPQGLELSHTPPRARLRRVGVGPGKIVVHYEFAAPGVAHTPAPSTRTATTRPRGRTCRCGSTTRSRRTASGTRSAQTGSADCHGPTRTHLAAPSHRFSSPPEHFLGKIWRPPTGYPLREPSLPGLRIAHARRPGATVVDCRRPGRPRAALGGAPHPALGHARTPHRP